MLANHSRIENAMLEACLQMCFTTVVKVALVSTAGYSAKMT